MSGRCASGASWATRPGRLPRSAQRRHFDIERRLLTVHTKGGRIYPVPIPEEALWLALGRLELEAQWREDDFLLYRQDTRRIRVDPAEAEEVLTIGNDKIGYARITRRRHDRKPTGKLVHRWWYRCLERSGLVTEGASAPHGRDGAPTLPSRLRLTQLLLGHQDIRSTARYAQLDTADLAQALLEMQEGQS